MKWNLTSKLYTSFTRSLSNAENDSFCCETQEASEPVFWAVFSLLMLFSVAFTLVSAASRWFGKQVTGVAA
jgi:hypothetical protein